MEYVSMVCNQGELRPCSAADVRWLDWAKDSSLARALWTSAGSVYSDEAWDELWHGARADGYRYCAVVKDGAIISRAAVWRYSDKAWEAAAVYTAPAKCRRGYGKAVISFVTAHILDAGRVATCHTSDDNLAMIRTAEAVGFHQVEPLNGKEAAT